MNKITLFAKCFGMLLGIILGYLVFSVGLSGLNYFKNPTGTLNCGCCLDFSCEAEYGKDNFIIYSQKGGAGLFHMFETLCWCEKKENCEDEN